MRATRTSRASRTAANVGAIVGAIVAAIITMVALVGSTGCGPKVLKNKPAAISPIVPNHTLYEQGLALLEQGKFEKARTTLTEVGTREAIEPGLDPLVKIAVADAYYYQPGIDNIIEAQSRYTQFVSFYPTHPLAGYAQFQIGMCDLKQSPNSFLDQTYTRKAIEEFDRVSAVDLSSRFVAAAEQMKQNCYTKIAKHDYDVGIFYYKKKAWKGAVGRLKKLIEEAPTFEASDAAYYYLGMALVQDGSGPEGRIYLEKVARDYPGSPYAPKAQSEIDKIPEPVGG